MRTKCRTVAPGDAWDHFDNYLIHLAKSHPVELLGLETDSMQLGLIQQEYATANWKSLRPEIIFFIDALHNTRAYPQACEFADAYRDFRIDYQLNGDCPEDVLIRERNRAWMPLLTPLLSQKNCFVAVGLLHLMCACGLLEQFRQQGFVVRSIPLTRSGP
ncbi:MAG: TraB/GumN family protein [Cyclobacteriaceae bacterium]|jgi:uncharacterized protein YbaP (TraB family)|nr:TraB/GumN family protein [Cyclobacteriaceae bacterium]